eukprot:973369-Prorocentrum_minimum.AAC.1
MSLWEGAASHWRHIVTVGTAQCDAVNAPRWGRAYCTYPPVPLETPPSRRRRDGFSGSQKQRPFR